MIYGPAQGAFTNLLTLPVVVEQGPQHPVHGDLARMRHNTALWFGNTYNNNNNTEQQHDHWELCQSSRRTGWRASTGARPLASAANSRPSTPTVSRTHARTSTRPSHCTQPAHWFTAPSARLHHVAGRTQHHHTSSLPSLCHCTLIGVSETRTQTEQRQREPRAGSRSESLTSENSE